MALLPIHISLGSRTLPPKVKRGRGESKRLLRGSAINQVMFAKLLVFI